MKYMILMWDELDRKWHVKHYTHDYDDFQRMCERYPESAGYVHMINVRAANYHEVMTKIRNKT